MWEVTHLSTDTTDIGDTSGVISIPDSADTAVLEILIQPDTVPEVDERFNVTMVMTSQTNQRIRPEQVMNIFEYLLDLYKFMNYFNFSHPFL